MVYGYDRSQDYDDDAASDVSTENFNSGEGVLLDGKSRGKVAYFGPVHFSHDDDWVGIVLDEPSGKHNGTVAGTEYFRCDSMHGLFVRSHRLQRTDSSGHVTARVKSPYRLRPKSAASLHSQELDYEDIFSRAEQTDPLGYFEARAGSIKSHDQPDAINSKLDRLVEDMDQADQVSFASPWIHSSRTPTPTQQKYNTGVSVSRAKPGPSSLAKRSVTINKPSGKAYGITMGYGELDRPTY